MTNPDGPDLNLVHRIDQAQASAFQRIDTLLGWIDQWLNEQGFTDEQMFEALDDPNAFYALLQIMRTRVDVREAPNMLAAAVLKLAKQRLEELT